MLRLRMTSTHWAYADGAAVGSSVVALLGILWNQIELMEKIPDAAYW